MIDRALEEVEGRQDQILPKTGDRNKAEQMRRGIKSNYST